MTIRDLKEIDGTVFEPSTPSKIGYGKGTVTSLTSETTTQTTGNGWVVVWGIIKGSDSSNNRINITVNSGSKVGLQAYGSENMSIRQRCPVKSGDNITVTYPTGGGRFSNWIEGIKHIITGVC